MPTTPTEGPDMIEGTSDADTLDGLGGNDTIYGGAGADLLRGGLGQDQIFGGDHGDTLYGGENDDYLSGGGMVDVLYGEEGNDRLELGSLFGGVSTGEAYGGAGNDHVQIYDARDVTVRGGIGDDRLEILWSGSLIPENATIDFDAGIATSQFGMSVDFAEFERLLVYLSVGNDTVAGSAGDDFIWVDQGANRVDARDGDDWVRYQFGGANTLEGGAGSDRLVAYAAADQSVYFVYDSFAGDVDDGQLSSISGFEHYDVIGHNLNDFIATGAGDDALYGGDGHDEMASRAGRDTLYGGGGNDTMNGAEGTDTLVGDAGNDRMSGGDDRDVMTGSEGADRLDGGNGNDFVNGGWGYDRAVGGLGADAFYHMGTAGHGSDWVEDYDASQNDVLIVGLANATRGQFQVNFATTPDAGASDVAEAFVIYRPTGQVLWALTDGAAQDHINLRIGDQTFDLLV